ncbi:MAG: TonB-dependent siderophore receptor [Opitutales bacterium]
MNYERLNTVYGALKVGGVALSLGCTPLLGQTSPANAGEEEEILTLDAFAVQETEDNGYLADYTLSGNLVNVPLADVPASISVMDRQLLKDIVAEDMFDAVNYSVGAYNQRDAFSGSTGSNGNSIVFRGIQTNWQARDNFRWYLPSDNYNVSQVEINRGPVGILYGESSVTGVMNVVTRQASFSDGMFGEVTARFDENGTWRFSTDLNVPVNDQFAFRVMTLAQEKESWVDPLGDDRWGVTASALYQPFENTRIRLSGEWGEINRRQKSFVTREVYSNFDLSQASNDPDVTVPGAFSISGFGGPNGAVIQDDNLITLGLAPEDYDMRLVFAAPAQAVLDGDPLPIDEVWGGLIGTNDRDFWTLTLELEQQVWDDLLFKASLNYQDQVGWASFPQQVLTVDPNRRIPDPDNPSQLIDNPRFGDIVSYQWDRGITPSNRQWQARFMGLYDLNLPWMRQQITFGTYHRRDEFVQNSFLQALDPEYARSLGLTPDVNTNRVMLLSYLDEGQPTKEDFGLPNVSTYFGRNNFFHSRTQLDSYYANSYGQFWDDRITTMIGIRHDDYSRFRWLNDIDRFGRPLLRRDANGDRIGSTPQLSNATIVNYGLTAEVWDGVTLFYNNAESFIFATYRDIFGEDGGPEIGKGDDYGVRLDFLDNTVRLNFTIFNNQLTNEGAGSIGGQNSQRFQEAVAFFGDVFEPGGNDSRNRKVTGYELELVGSPFDGLTFRLGYSDYDFEFSNQFPRLRSLIEEMDQAGADNDSLKQYVNNSIATAMSEDQRITWAARYTLPVEALRGTFVGLSGYYQSEQPGPGDAIQEELTVTNLLLGYKTRWQERYDVTFRLNVQNIFDEQTRFFGFSADRVQLSDPRVVSAGVDIAF